jgi:hypothetical protein
MTRGWHNKPIVAAVPSGPNWTPSPNIPIKKKIANSKVLIENLRVAQLVKKLPASYGAQISITLFKVALEGILMEPKPTVVNLTRKCCLP